MIGRDPIDEGTGAVSDDAIAAFAARMAKIVIDFEGKAAGVRAAFDRKIANGRAIRWRKLDELHSVLVKAKAAAGEKMARVEFQRRKNIEVIIIDGIPAGYVDVTDGISDNPREKIGRYHLSSPEGGAVQGAREILRGPSYSGDLKSTLDQLAAFTAMILARPAGEGRQDYTKICDFVDGRKF